MQIERTFDYELVNSILTHPEIYKTIADDAAPPIEKYKTPESEEIIYLVAAGEPIGVMIYHPTSSITVDCHVQVLPQHRKQYAKAFGEAVINWLWKNTSFLKINAQIPFCYPNVCEFAVLNGFEVEGTNKCSYLKNNQIHDQWYLGLARPSNGLG